MLEFLIVALDVLVLLTWVPKALVNLWRWLTEERAAHHMQYANDPTMASIRWFSRLVLGLWLVLALASAIHWIDAWADSLTSFFAGIAGFLAGPVLLVWATGLWRDRVVASLRR